MPPVSAFFVAPQGRPAPAPCLVHCSELLRLFVAPEGREKSPEKGTRHSGRFRWPSVPPDPKGGSRGALALPCCAHFRVAPGPSGGLLQSQSQAPNAHLHFTCGCPAVGSATGGSNPATILIGAGGVPPVSVFFFVAPQGRPALAPCLLHCSGLLRLFSAPEGREKSPKRGRALQGLF